MAPVKKTKQTLLRISDFAVQPSAATLKRRKKLEKEMQPFITGKTTVDKKRERRIAEEKKIQKGAEKWHSHLMKSGVESDESFTKLLYLSNGCNPPRPVLEETDDGIEDIESTSTDENDIVFDTLDDV